MSLSADLLDQARFLAKKESGKPKQASLRRAVSTAYYSLFHFLGEECSGIVCGVTPDKRALRELVCRALDHGKMKTLCQQFKSQKDAQKLLLPFWSTLPIASTKIDIVAASFVKLQQERHRADYDVSSPFTRSDAYSACDMAEASFAAWSEIKAKHYAVANLFAVSLLLWPSLASRQ